MQRFSMNNYNVFNPVKIIFGSGRISELGDLSRSLADRVFVVTMPDLVELGIIEPALESLEAAGVSYSLFKDVKPEPKSADIDAATSIIRESNCDAIIGIGGGSAIDFAKALAISSTHSLKIWEYVNLSNRPPQPLNESAVLPIIAIPTTTGTGAEVTPYAVITNSETIQKGTIKESAIYPRIALVDPALTIGLPPAITAATGVDAFAHALESYFNVPGRTPYSDMIVEEAIRCITKYLPLVCKNGSDIDARAGMAWGATLGGLAISQAGTTVAHALAQPLGARTGLPHGVTVAIFLAAVMESTLPKDQERFVRIATLMGDTTGLSKTDAAWQAIELIKSFIENTGGNFKISSQYKSACATLITELAHDVYSYMSRPLQQHSKIFTEIELQDIVKKSF